MAPRRPNLRGNVKRVQCTRAILATAIRFSLVFAANGWYDSRSHSAAVKAAVLHGRKESTYFGGTILEMALRTATPRTPAVAAYTAVPTDWHTADYMTFHRNRIPTAAQEPFMPMV